MMFINFLRLAKKNIKKNKIIFFSSFFLMVSLILIIITLSMTKTIKQYVLNDNNNNLNHRTFLISSSETGNLSEIYKNLIKIENVNQVSETYEYRWNGYIEEFQNNDYNGYIELTGLIKENVPKINQGSLENYDREDEVIQIVCPSKLMPDYNIMFDPKWKDKKIVNTSDYFGKILTMKENEIESHYEIIATYDTSENNADEYQCYTSPKNVSDLYLKTTGTLSSDGYLIAIVDKYDNVDKVLNVIQELGYNYLVVQETSDNLINYIFKIGTIISTFMLIVTILIIYINYGKMIKSRNYELYLLKILGYDFNQIKLLLVIENILVGVGTFFCSTIISVIGLQIFQFYLYSSSIGNSKIVVYLSWNAVIIAMILAIMLPIISIIFSFKNKNNSLVSEIK